jgi:hypothetical protein
MSFAVTFDRTTKIVSAIVCAIVAGIAMAAPFPIVFILSAAEI